MNRIIALFRMWLGLSKVTVQIASLRKLVSELHSQREASDQKLAMQLEEIESLRKTFADRVGSYQAELESAKILNKKIDAALQVALEAIEAKENIVIPGLVAANRVLVDRWDAESKVLQLRKLHAAAQQSE